MKQWIFFQLISAYFDEELKILFMQTNVGFSLKQWLACFRITKFIHLWKCFKTLPWISSGLLEKKRSWGNIWWPYVGGGQLQCLAPFIFNQCLALHLKHQETISIAWISEVSIMPLQAEHKNYELLSRNSILSYIHLKHASEMGS